MNEDIHQLLGIGEFPTPPLTAGTARRLARWMPWGGLICAACALFFLFKPEGGSWSATFMGSDNQVHTVSTRGVSALSYYVRWSAADRKALEEREQAGLYMRVLASNFTAEALLNTVPQRLARNTRTAAFFATISLILFLAGRYAFRPTQERGGIPAP
jgi:hypothetical protein